MDTTALLKGGESWSAVRSPVGGVDQIFTVCHRWLSRHFIVLVLVASSAGRSSRSSVVISPAGACMLWDSLESLLKWAASVWASGQHTVSRLSQSSVARLAARARQLCDPGQHPGWPRPPGLPAAPGGPSESVVSGKVGSSCPPIMRPGTAPRRAASAEDVGCICRSRTVPE